MGAQSQRYAWSASFAKHVLQADPGALGRAGVHHQVGQVSRKPCGIDTLRVCRAELGLVAAQLWQVGATGHRVGLGHAWVEHQVGQVCARPSLECARADGAHRRAPWRHAARSGARVHHAAPVVEHHQRAAARGAPQRVPGPV